MHVLLIEDDPLTADYVERGLREAGHRVDVSRDGGEGLVLALEGAYDVVVVDRMLPSLDGLSIVRSLRASERMVPVLILSALGEVDHRVEGLRAGGDDYLIKPFAFSELAARLEALVRRAATVPETVATRLEVADLVLDRLKRKVFRAGNEIALKPRELALLEYLMEHAGQVVTRTMLLERVWGYHFDPQTNVIDVHISRLRSKIDRGYEPALLHTVRGAGYMVSG